MNISDRQVRIIVADIVSQCRSNFFHPQDCDNLKKSFDDANLRVEVILLIFPECKLSRYIKNAQDEIHQMRQLTLFSYPEMFDGSCTESPGCFGTLDE